MDETQLITRIAFALAFLSLLITATIMYNLISVQRDIYRVTEEIKTMASYLGNNTGRIVLVNVCIKHSDHKECFYNHPVHAGETFVTAIARITDVTIGVRNSTLTILSLGKVPECKNWSLLAYKNDSWLRVPPDYPLFGGETLILSCSG
ncbi:MAG: hypothetical protein ACP5IE_08100 [Infirmifilum sp.]